ncbi:MAG: hypothetical protein FWD02_06605 [Bacteroidales bacterium]|nr:hypothetical protein [Bacteroidales bacterium]
MQKKPYFTDDAHILMTVNEPALAYQTANHNEMAADVSTSKERFNNPNVPFHCTEDEFLEHIRSIEQSIERGEFMTAEQSDRYFEEWKKEYLANRMRQA